MESSGSLPRAISAGYVCIIIHGLGIILIISLMHVPDAYMLEHVRTSGEQGQSGLAEIWNRFLGTRWKRLGRPILFSCISSSQYIRKYVILVSAMFI